MPVPPEFTIDESLFSRLKDKVVVVTGGSSGIGLATTELLLSLGAKVVQGDLQPPPPTSSSRDQVVYKKTDVTSWKDLVELFKEAKNRHGRIDHVYANAGVGGIPSYVEGDEFDANGELKEPDHIAIHTMLIGVANTAKLAIYHMKTQQPAGGSIVFIASASSFQRFQLPDYTTAKHGVLGLMRALGMDLYPKVPIRLNSMAPGWTITGLVNEEALKEAGVGYQLPDVVAKNVALLMSDETRNQQCCYSDLGKYWEFEEQMLANMRDMLPRHGNEGDDFTKIQATSWWQSQFEAHKEVVEGKKLPG